MKRFFLAVAIVASAYSVGYAQCNEFYALQDGSEWELESYNAKRKLAGKHHQKVTSFTETSDGYKANVSTTAYDQKGKELMQGNFDFICSNGTMIIDMRNFVNQEQMKAFSDADMDIETENLEIPATLSPGQTLKDGKLTISAGGGSAIPMKITFTITDRKVQGKEKVNTPAGTFECYKITSKMKMQSQMGMTVNTEMSTTEWLAPRMGTIKSESYSKQGKLMGYTVLSKRIN